MHWWTTLVAAVLQWLSKSTGRQMAIGAALFLILLGILLGSTATVVFGGALLFFLLSRLNANS
jgi:4-amino-4-deoxy-L-arabinose transferase-like glycosyltransferase